MNIEQAEAICRAARLLGSIHGRMRNWSAYLTEDEDGQPITHAALAKPKRQIIDRAITRYREVDVLVARIREFSEFALPARWHFKVLRLTHLFIESLASADVAAELAMIDGEDIAALDCLVNAGERARRICKLQLVYLEAELLAYVSLHGRRKQETPPRKCRLEVQSDTSDHVLLDGKPYEINDRAAAALQLMIDADGDWITASAEPTRCKSEHLDKLPECILNLVERQRAKGCRLKADAWGAAD